MPSCAFMNWTSCQQTIVILLESSQLVIQSTTPSCPLHHIIKNTSDRDASQKLLSPIQTSNLQNSIRWLSAIPRLESFIKTASMHLVTSSFEVSPMTFIESKFYSVPLVTYQMLYVDILQDKLGSLSVPQRDIHSSAVMIINLLEDKQLWKKLSREASESAHQYLAFNQEDAWKTVISALESSPYNQHSQNYPAVDRHNLDAYIHSVSSYLSLKASC